MYSSGYSQVSKHSPQAQKRMQYRSKGKSCGYYMRIVFFFSSLIQSLIIVSLVLFLVYGKNQDSASTARIQDLEESFSRLSIENVGLRQQRKNLTTLLNATLTEKARNDWDLVKIRHLINISVVMIQDLEKRHQQCNTEMMMYRISGQGCKVLMPTSDTCNCGMLVERMKARLDLVESNFTQTIKTMRVEVEQTARERDYINLEAIRLRRDKSTQEKELQFYKQRCKEDFSQSLSGVSNVSKAFLLKIESLFPTHIAFQLTCPKQREHLEQIRANCTNLSREVEDKLQRYLNTVGEQVSEIQAENSRFKAENWRLSEDYRWCTQNRSGLIQEHKQNFEKLQRKHDQDKEKLLMEKMRLIGEKEVLEQSVRYKSKEVDHLTVQVKHLNMSCVRKPQFGGSTTQLGTSSQSGWNWSNGGGSSSATSSSTGRVGGLGSSFGSSGTQFNKLGSTGTGSSSSSFGSIPSLGSSGTGFNKLGSTGTGSSSSSFGSSSSLGSSGTGFNKLGSTGTGSSSSSFGSSSSLGSSSTGFNKLGSTGTGSSSSSFSSLGSNPSLSSSGIGSNKPALGARGSSTIGSSSGSLGTSSSLGSSGIGANKPTSNAKSSQVFSSWFGTGNSNSGQSKPGSGTGKVLSSGSSYGGTGSSLGRTNGVGGGSVNVAQHLQELQRIINPSSPQDKQDLSRMLG